MPSALGRRFVLRGDFMDRARRLPLMIAAAPLMMGVSSFVACSGGEVGDSLRRDFPTRAAEALTSTKPFERGPRGGFTAAGAHFDVSLPAAGDGDIRFTTHGGQEVRIRERGAIGPATRQEGAIAYRREGGRAFWTVKDDGVEEWLAVEAASVVRGEPVAAWTIDGARFERVRDVVAVIDEADGKAMLRVAAPNAYGADGREIGVRLDVVDGSMVLEVDADNERVLVDPSWTNAAAMANRRSEHTATLLPDGRVLVTGGRGDFGATVTVAELWDPAQGMWSPTANGAPTGPLQAAALLSDGRVGIFGGLAAGEPTPAVRAYDPVGNSWAALTMMNAARDRHTVTALLDGSIFIYGGAQIAVPGQRFTLPNTYVNAGGNSTRNEHTATRLVDGRVLIAGGTVGFVPSISVEIFDPSTNTVAAVQPMNVARRSHAAALLPDGRVLVVGGNGSAGAEGRGEIYDPATNGWTLTPLLSQARVQFTLSLLPNGQVAAIGGDNGGSTPLATIELFDPAGNAGAGSWTGGLTMSDARIAHTATVLADQTVLVAGGFLDFESAFATTEIYDALGGFGDACQGPLECSSGFCVDNNCCDSACIGECQTCNNGGSGICIDRPNNDLCNGGTCQIGVCIPDPLVNGAACVNGGQCNSGNCVDDVCCNSTCVGECNACSIDAGGSADGLCLPIADDTSCSIGVCESGSCVPDLLANGAACVNGGQCDSGNCVDDVCCDTACDLNGCFSCSIDAGSTEDGFCMSVVGRSCTDFNSCTEDETCDNEGSCSGPQIDCTSECREGNFCTKGQCFGNFPDATECSNGGECLAGICIPEDPFPNGTACLGGAQCLSGNCVDDVCCNTECLGECVACSNAEGGEVDGTCSPVEDGATCGGEGSCNAGECLIPLPNGEDCELAEACNSGNCVDDVCCATACVGECVACSLAEGGTQDGACTPVDDGTACEGGSCSDGLCVIDSLLDLGEACDSAAQCASDFCTGGVCCNSACDGACDACSTDEGGGEDGTCDNASGRSCDDGDACTQTDTCEDRACAGADPISCTPAACQIASSCNAGSGACVPVSFPDGAPCEGGLCFAGSCTADPDVGSLSGVGTGNPSSGPGGTGNASGPSGTASGPSGATGAGAGSGNGDDGDVDNGESSDGCSVGSSPRRAVDLAWLVVAAAVGARWRGTRRPAVREGRRVQS